MGNCCKNLLKVEVTLLLLLVSSTVSFFQSHFPILQFWLFLRDVESLYICCDHSVRSMLVVVLWIQESGFAISRIARNVQKWTISTCWLCCLQGPIPSCMSSACKPSGLSFNWKACTSITPNARWFWLAVSNWHQQLAILWSMIY